MRGFEWCLLLLTMTGVSGASTKDCAFPACPEIRIAGDEASTLPTGAPSPFRGFADATLRLQPDSERLWMAYSWPSVRRVEEASQVRSGGRGGSVPQVYVHLAYSDDHGRTWRFSKTLWSPTPFTGPHGEVGHMSHEVANLLPVREASGVVWYGARLDYFLPDDGGFRKRPPQSFRIILGRAASPGELVHAESIAIGSMATDRAWGMDVDLARLSTETSHCGLWNEPAMYHDGKELFLVLSCMAFQGKTPDLDRSDLVVFAARTDGRMTDWQWRYAGKLAGATEARALGAERLTQIDLVESRDGRLLAIMTPDTWNAEASDFVHHGCVAVEVEQADRSLRLARDIDGHLQIAARVTASDAGAEGTAACTYDPASETGIILGRRNKVGVGLGHARDRASAQMYGALHATGIHP